MLKVIVIEKEEASQDLQYWQETFNDVWEGPVEISITSNYLQIQDADLYIIDLSRWEDSAFDALQKVSHDIAGKHCLIVSNKKDVDLALEAVKLGAIGFLVKPFKRADLIASLDRLHTVKFISPQETDTNKKAKIVPLISYKGGTGVTTIAVNLGYTLAKIYNKKTLIIDACAYANHVAFLLNVIPKCSLANILQEGKNIDEQYITAGSKTPIKNLNIISGFTKGTPMHIDENSIGNLNHMMQIASSVYDYVLIDTSARLLDTTTMFFLQHANYVLLVTNHDLLALKDTKFYISTLTELGLRESIIKPIINKYDLSSGNLEPDLFKKQIDIPIFYDMPNVWDVCIRAINSCNPILEEAPNSKLSASFKNLAEKVISLDSPVVVEAEKPKGLLGWIKDIKITTSI